MKITVRILYRDLKVDLVSDVFSQVQKWNVVFYTTLLPSKYVPRFVTPIGKDYFSNETSKLLDPSLLLGQWMTVDVSP